MSHPSSQPLPTLSQIQSLLHAFATSTTTATCSPKVKLIHSIPSGPSAPSAPSPAVQVGPSSSWPHHLLILDSSFNPPTKAHGYLVREAVRRLRLQGPSKSWAYNHHHHHHHDGFRIPAQAQTQTQTQARILLLLSTKNADKPSAPAKIEQRLLMMVLFARDLWRGFSDLSAGTDDGGGGGGCALDGCARQNAAFAATTGNGTASDDEIASKGTIAGGMVDGGPSEARSEGLSGLADMRITGIDVAISSEPRFLEKSIFLSSRVAENPYAGSVSAEFDSDGDGDGGQHDERAAIPQWHLLGFDTLIRLLDPKYYPPSGSLDVLAPLFEGAGIRNRILVFRRGGSSDEVGGNDEQGEYVETLTLDESHENSFRVSGWKSEWAEKIELVPAFEGIDDENGSIKNVSSTAVRSAAEKEDALLVEKMCGESVGRYVMSEQLYTEL